MIIFDQFLQPCVRKGSLSDRPGCFVSLHMQGPMPRTCKIPESCYVAKPPLSSASNPRPFTYNPHFQSSLPHLIIKCHKLPFFPQHFHPFAASHLSDFSAATTITTSLSVPSSPASPPQATQFPSLQSPHLHVREWFVMILPPISMTSGI